MTEATIAHWSQRADMSDGLHTRDVWAREDRKERVRTSTRFTQSDGLHVLSAGWAAYNRNIYPVTDQYGREHLITLKQHKVYLWALARIAADDCNTSMRAAARDLEVCVTTVSNTLRRMTAWGLIGYLANRGKYGGLTLFGRVKGDGLERFARMAADVIKAAWERKMDAIRARFNVHSVVDRVGRGPTSIYPSSRVDIKTRDDEIEAALMALQRGSMRRVPCPAHGGEGRNLSFWRRPDGSLGTKCWSHQCTEHDVKDAIVAWPR